MTSGDQPEICMNELTENQRIEQAAARLRLAAEVDKKKMQLASMGNGAALEKAEVALRPPDDIVSIAEVMPLAMSVFERMGAKWKEFCASQRANFDAAPLSMPCEVHPDYLRMKLFESSCLASRDSAEWVTIYDACPLCAKEAKREEGRAVWRRRGVPDRVIDARFDNFFPSCSDAMRIVEDAKTSKKTFLIFLGTPGTGKTHLAAAVLMASAGGIFVTHADMMNAQHWSYQETGTTDRLERDWRKAPVLVIDDFGSLPAAKDEEALLYSIIGHRYDKRLRTVITSNLTTEEFRQRIGFRLLDRIQESALVSVATWPSYRRNSQ